ncbi:MAG: serine hydrolase [Caulobacteraceae bacterium]|nr:serine hydrolase [Caulobacteraceae bacterium]
MMNVKKIAACLMAGLALSAGAADAAVPPPAPQVASAAPASPILDDVTTLAPFVDGVMTAQMEQWKIPGAVIVIVKDGKTLLAKGYGYADVEKGARVNPDKSLFRIASTTKLFTWTAVMQLVEQGRLNLDADVNTYLKSFKIPATYAKPVTLRSLLTHTAGFEEGSVGYGIALQPEPSIAKVLGAHIPARVRPPGEMLSYSNYGAALAGLIVQEVTGVPYEDYVQRNIFDPLGMKYATVREPVPAALVPYKVNGYAWENGAFVFQKQTFEGGFRPAGSGAVSGADMARFMIAQLQDGEYDGKRILQPATARLMRTPAFYYDKRFPAMDLGFYETAMGGQMLVGHGGSDPAFNTELSLLPAHNLGVFISFSGGEGGVAAENVEKALLARYYPPQGGAPASYKAASLEKYAGSYQFTRRSHTKVDKVYDLLSRMPVKVSGEGLSVGQGNDAVQFAPTGPDLFQEIGGQRRIAFRVDGSGAVTHMFMDFLSPIPLERASLLDDTALWYPVLVVALLLFGSALLGFLYRRREIWAAPRADRRLILISTAVSLWGPLTLAALFVFLILTDVVARQSSVPLSLKLALGMPIVFIGLTAASLVAVVRVWMRKGLTLRLRLYHSAIALAALGVVAFFAQWNLLGWRFG